MLPQSNSCSALRSQMKNHFLWEAFPKLDPFALYFYKTVPSEHLIYNSAFVLFPFPFEWFQPSWTFKGQEEYDKHPLFFSSPTFS